jgi:hypothetical protein
VAGKIPSASVRWFGRWGKHPIENALLPVYSSFVKHNKFSQNQKPAGVSQPTTVLDLTQSGIDFMPSPDEVARKAYFTYVNEGSLPGHEVQHWLKAEAELIAERKLTRVHGFHNRT